MLKEQVSSSELTQSLTLRPEVSWLWMSKGCPELCRNCRLKLVYRKLSVFSCSKYFWKYTEVLSSRSKGRKSNLTFDRNCRGDRIEAAQRVAEIEYWLCVVLIHKIAVYKGVDYVVIPLGVLSEAAVKFSSFAFEGAELLLRKVWFWFPPPREVHPAWKKWILAAWSLKLMILRMDFKICEGLIYPGVLSRSLCIGNSRVLYARLLRD